MERSGCPLFDPPYISSRIQTESFSRERRNGWRCFAGEAITSLEMETIMTHSHQSIIAASVDSKYPGRPSFTPLPKGGGGLV